MMRKHILTITIILLSIVTLNAQNFHVNEDFDNGTLPTGWTNNAVNGGPGWDFSVNGGFNLDGTSMALFDDDALGAASDTNTVELITPTFDNSSFGQTTLNFDYNFRQYNAISDSFAVAVFDGTNWVTVFTAKTDQCGDWTSNSCRGANFPSQPNFPNQNIDISAYANANCQVRFIYHDGNNPVDWGWYAGIDNVVISSPFPNDVGVSELFDPSPGCGLTSAQTVQVEIKNYGTLPASGFGITLDIDNGTQTLNETVSGTIPAGDSLTYTFTGTVNMQTVAFYDFNVYTNLTGDGNNDNDSLIITVENEPSFVPTFTDNFEGFNRWKVGGQNVSWEIGTPNASYISGPISGTNAYVTNLDGLYNTNEDSYLESPCFDFSTAIGDPIVTFSMIYNIENTYDRVTFESSIDNGLTWQVVLPSVNPTNWFNVGQHWEGVSGGWIPVENILTGLAGQNSVKLRFKLNTDGSTNREGVGIDDFNIRYPQPIDISLNSIDYPSTTGTPLCGLGSENIIVELENKGANTINSVQMNYRINGGTVVTETFTATILPNTVTSYTFNTQFNFTALPSATIDVWADAAGDGFNQNDSILNRTILNSTSGASAMPFVVDFDALGWGRGNGGQFGTSLFAAGWSKTPNANGSYAWHVWNAATNAFNSGPNFGQGGSGNFLHVTSNGGNAGNVARFETPCINLSSVSGAVMEYWTHGFGLNISPLVVEIYDGSGWTVIDRVQNFPQTSSASFWNKQTVNLSAYAGRRIKLRFSTTKVGFGQGDLGVDNIEIFEPIPNDGKMVRVVSPVTGCTPSGNITVEVENFGTAPLTNIPVSFSIDGGITINGVVPGTLAPGATTLYTFPVTGNFTQKARTYSLRVRTDVVGDSNLINDELVVDITNTTKDVTFVEDFSGFTDGSCNGFNSPLDNLGDVLGDGWEEASTNTYQWNVHDAGVCGGTQSGGTGAATDHTSGGGKYIYAEASGGTGDAILVTPCIDFKGRSGAAMIFWYHMWGNTIDSLVVEALVNGVWNEVGFIAGAVQSSAADPWEEAIFKFNQFAGQDLQFRFRAVKNGGGVGADIGIDDLSFFAPFGKDARMLEVTGPTSGCDISSQSNISVRFDNFGTQQIEPDSLTLYLQVDNNPPISEVISFAVPAEDTVDYTFTQTVDLSIKGKTYLIKAWTALNGEEDFDNDTLYDHKIINETKDTDYYENFETSRDAKCDEMIGQVLENGWVASNDDSFSWHVQSSLCGKGSATTPTTTTGPQGDRTTGSGMFIYAEANGRGIANFQSPCIDLTTNVNPRLSFWYHRYGGNMVPMRVYVDTNGVEDQVAILNGQAQTSADDIWKQFTVDLSAYAGHLISVHFRATKPTNNSQRSDMALDDIFFYEAIPKDAGVTEIIQPNGDACALPSSASVEIKIENFGLNDILPGELSVEYGINDGPITSETIQQTITAGSNLIYTFATPIDLSAPGRKRILARTVLANDTIVANDISFKKVTNRSPGIPRYFMDFEDLVQSATAGDYRPDDLRDFVRIPANGGLAGTVGGQTAYMWHVVTGAAPSVDGQAPILTMIGGPSTGPSGDHTFATNTANGAGTYMLVESNIEQLLAPIPPTIPDAILTLPCGPIDLSQSINDKVLLSFWYHMYGGETGELTLNVKVESSGVNYTGIGGSIIGEQHSDDTDRWLQKQISLERFIDSGLISLSFIAYNSSDGSYPGQGRGGDIAIDDIEILDRLQNDASMFSLLDPESDCALGISEPLEVRIQNLGTEDILKINVGYQIQFTPLDGGPVRDTIVKDSAVGITIIPLAFYDFSFQDIDMSASGEYKIKVWTEYQGDTNAFNDTICESIFNVTRPFPSCDDFSELLYDDQAKNFKDGILRNNWEANTTPAYTFKASIEGNPDVPEIKGHTGGLNDIFMLAFDGDGMPNQEAFMISACYDLNTTRAANLEFWYIMPSSASELLIEAREVGGGGWQAIDTIGPGDPKVEWTKRRVVLADFVGGFVEFRFTGLNVGNGYYAIDDVCLVRPKEQQIAFQEFLDPLEGRCFYSSDQRVGVRLRNIGIDNIDSFQVVLAVDKYIISNPRGNIFRDTITIYPNAAPPFFEPGDRFTLILDSLGWGIDMTEKTDYYFHFWVLLDGDEDFEDNYRLDYKVNHPGAESLPYVITFEELPDRLNSLIPSVFNNPLAHHWTINSGSDRLFPGITGPALDHTKGPVDTTGFYLVTQADQPMPSVIGVTSPCVDLTGTIRPEIKYWYHMFGFEMGNLYLEINDDEGWVRVDSLIGEEPRQSSNARTPWISRIISLDQYKEKFIKFRFVSVRGGRYSHMGIDDISVYDAVAKDVGVASLTDPTADSTYCYAEKNPFKVDIINNGSDSLDFTTDTLLLSAIIRKDSQGNGNFVVIDTLIQEVTTNQWEAADNNIYPVPRDSIVTIAFDSTFDMSDTGSFYQFYVLAELEGDFIRDNDELPGVVQTIKSQRKTGQIVSIFPNDTICKDSALKVSVRNNFGKLQWEQLNVLNENNPLGWRIGASNPSDRRDYFPRLDTIHYLRARVCVNLLFDEGIDETTDSVRLEIFAPSPPNGNAGGRCLFGVNSTAPDIYRSQVPSGLPTITDVSYFEGKFKTSNRIFTTNLAPDFAYQSPTRLTETTTIYARSIVHIPGVANVGVNGLYCVSDSAGPITREIEEPIVPDLGPNYTFCRNGELVDTLGIILNAGQRPGVQANYLWTREDLNQTTGALDTLPTTTQTLAIDVWQLNLNTKYRYEVKVTTEKYGCVGIDDVTIEIGDSCITSIENYELRQEFGIFPNPVSDVLTITHESVENFSGEIRLFGAEGRLLQLFENVTFGKLNHQIDMGDLAKGVYFIKIETDKGTIVQKVVKS